jgi:RNA polymerase sigma factor (sigma-70 family)
MPTKHDAPTSGRGFGFKRAPFSPAKIVAEIAAGNRAAESELVMRYGPALHYILLREVHDPACADDLYQESFRITLERLRKRGLDQPDKLAGFLMGVARLLVRSHRREAAERAATSSNRVEEIADSEPTPLELVIRSEQASSLRAAIERLDVPRDRELLQRYLLDQDKETICHALGIRIDHFNKMIYRARLRLMRRFGID